MNAMRNGERATLHSRRRAPAGGLLIIAVVALPSAGPFAGADDGAAAEAERPEVSAELRKVAEGYLKNRGAFRSFRCEFSYRVGVARDVEDALKNGPTLKPLTALCKWLLDDERICYSRVIDEKAKRASEDAKANPQHVMTKGEPGIIAEIPLSGRGYLTDGRRALSYDPSFVVNLMGPKRIVELIDDLSPEATPWALGGMGHTMRSNPGRWILDGKLGAWRLVGVEGPDGGKRMVVECRRATARLTYYFDPGRGFLPVRREYRLNDGRTTHLAITEVRKCSGGRWFPARVVSINTRADGTVWRVQEISLTALDVESKVKAEDMFLVLRPGIQVLHVDDMLSAFKLPAAERMGIGSLEALHVRCNEVAERRRRRLEEKAGN